MNDSIIVNVKRRWQRSIIPEAALLTANDTDPDSVLDITGRVASMTLLQSVSSRTLDRPTIILTVVNNDTDGGSFTYTATGGAQTDTASVSVTLECNRWHR